MSDRYDGYAFLAVEQLDGAHKLLRDTRTEFARLRGLHEWTEYRGQTVTYPEARWLRISLGLTNAIGGMWVEQISLRKQLDEIRINTARGTGRDGLDVAPLQIGVFDPVYRLRNTASVEPAPEQDVVRTPRHLKLDAMGYAACGVLGAANARWTPLLNAYDGYGRLRGAAGALMRHYNGIYRQSHWAFFGVENRDLFAAGDPGARTLLLEVFDALQRKTFLHEARTDFATYRQGEAVRIFTWASNYSCRKRRLTATFTVLEDESTRQQFGLTQEFELGAGESLPLEATWTGGSFHSRFYTVRVELFESGRRIDHVEAGFLAWDEKVLPTGFPLTYRDNYFRWNNRAVFLQGSDDYLHTFINQHENPKTWYADLVKLKDHGLLVYESLMGTRGLDDVPPEAAWRECDALMQMCQELKLISFPGMLVFGNTAASNHEIQHQAEFCRTFADRYHAAAGMMYFLNGDLQVRSPDIPDLRALFNEYLKQRYGTDSRLEEAWRVSPPEAKLGAVRPIGGTERWDDVRTFDIFRFKGIVVRRWLDSLAGEIRKVDPRHLVGAEFYARPVEGIDLITTIGSLEPGNIGYYDQPNDDVYLFPQTFRFTDMRARGKSLTACEFGMKTHPAWANHGRIQAARTEEEEKQLFLMVPHYAVGLGGSRVQNWCWKFPADFPFEWGINYPCDNVSRDPLLYYRNTALFFRQFDLKYETPETFFLIADNHRMGGQGDIVRQSQLNGIRYLMNLHCDFGAIDEFFLESLPSACKVLVYPLPFCPDDDAFTRVLEFVRSGGTLYVSGDVSYGLERKRTRTDRLEKLLGVRFESEIYPNVQFEGQARTIRPKTGMPGLAGYEGYPCIRVTPTTAEVVADSPDGMPVMFTNHVGRGRVFFSTDLLEMHAPARATRLGEMVYGSFLQWAGVKRPLLEPDNPWVHFFRSGTSVGTELFTLLNRDDSAPLQRLRFDTLAGRARVDVARRMTGAIAITRGRAVQSLETTGTVAVDGGTYCESTSHVMLFSLDGRDLKESGMLCVLPMGQGLVDISSRVLSAAEFQVGEFRNARWVALERGQVEVRDGRLRFEVNRDRDLGIILIATRERMPEAARRLTALLTLSEPATARRAGSPGL